MSKHRRSPKLAHLFVCAALVGSSTLPACTRAQRARSEPIAAIVPAPQPAPSSVRSGSRPEHKLVRDAMLSIEVTSYEAARPRIDAALAAAKGYVAQAKVEHQDGAVSNADLTLRVPAPALDRFLADCSGLGTVLEETLGVRDVSEEYYDTTARLANARRLEQRLLELISTKTENVKDLLEVERELARVREQIEALDGKIRLFDDEVAMSKVVLAVKTRDRFVAGPAPSFGEQVVRTFSESVMAVLEFGKHLVLVAVALVPWTPVLFAIGLGIWLFFRWLLRLLKSLADPPADPLVAAPGGSPPVVARDTTGAVAGPDDARSSPVDQPPPG